MIIKLLFLNLKDGSREKEKFMKSFQEIFGKNESFYLNHKGGLPSKATIFDKEKNKNIILDIQYVPLYDRKSKIKKLMFILNDITGTDENVKTLQKNAQKYEVINHLLNLKEKNEFSKVLSDIIFKALKILDELIKRNDGSHDTGPLMKLIMNLIEYIKKIKHFQN